MFSTMHSGRNVSGPAVDACPTCSGRGYTETSSRLTFGCDTAVRNTECVACSGTGTRPLESPPASPDSATLPTSSLTPGPAEIREGELPSSTVLCDYASVATCPTCDGDRYVDDGAVSLPCDACDRTGEVCSWCHGTLIAYPSPRAGECRSCRATAVHRTTFASAEAFNAAYDIGTADAPSWEGLYRRANDQAERFLVELSEARGKATRAENECAMLRSELASAKADLRAAMAKAQRKIEADHTEHLREVEDLKRQLRRRAVPMTADQLERDDGEVAA